MRSIYCAALIMAVASADNKAAQNVHPLVYSTMPATVEHIGPGLVPPPHLVAPVPLGVADHPYGHPYHRTPTSIVRDRYLGPVVHQTAFSRRELLGFGHDAERFDPARIVHSAEQLPLRVPRAFN